VSRASLIEAYVSALPFAAVAVVQTAGGCRVAVGGEIAPGETIAARFYFKPSHAELVLMTIGKEGLADKPPAAVAALIERTAAMLGAPHRTLDADRAQCGGDGQDGLALSAPARPAPQF
jgi:hypothetical protein